MVLLIIELCLLLRVKTERTNHNLVISQDGLIDYFMFETRIDQLPILKMGLEIYIMRKTQEEAAPEIFTYNKHFTVAKLDAIKLSGMRFLLKSRKYSHFAKQNEALKSILKFAETQNEFATNANV